MKVKSLLQDCPKRADLYAKGLAKNKRGFVLEGTIIPGICRLFRERADMEEVKNFIDEQTASYKEGWFDMEAQLTVFRELDHFALWRFAQWWHKDIVPFLKDVRCHVKVEYSKGDLESTIPLIFMDENGRVEAFLIRQKNHDGRSGVSRRCPMDQDLEALLALWYLASNGCGKADLSTVYLFTDKDMAGEGGAFLIEEGRPKAQVNLQRYRYSELREKDGTLSLPKIEAAVSLALDIIEKNAKPPYCAECVFNSLCRITPFSPVYVESMMKEAQEGKVYALPEFNEAQKEAVRCVNGPVALLCGPGSGKTSVMVGRAEYMINGCGISPDQMLMTSVTNQGVIEMRTRLETLLRDGSQLPEISTINALGYEILMSKASYLGYEPRLATQEELMHMAFGILSKLPPIAGLSYAKVYGMHGVVNRFLNICEAVHKRGFEAVENDSFYAKLDKDAFRRAYDEFEAATESLITFDDQVALCVQLFKEHPNVLRGYQMHYKYIMVDEYQDITDDAAEFIRLLAGDDPNLCVAGDDDQSIYGFSGGTNRHLVGFGETYPQARVVILNDNYRSTRQIVGDALRIIDRSTEKRIKKDLIAHADGPAPAVIPEASVIDVASIIKKEHEAGVPYSQIAVLSRKNDSIEQLPAVLKCPSQIVKAYTSTDPVCGILHDVYQMYFDGVSDPAMYHLIATFDREAADRLDVKDGGVVDAVCKAVGHTDFSDAGYFRSLKDASDPVVMTAKFLASCFRILSVDTTSMATIRQILAGLGLSDHLIASELSEAVAKDKMLSDNRRMGEYLDDMVRFTQGGRLDTGVADAVQLATAHDAKGAEWEVVIIWKTEDFSINIRGRRVPSEEETAEYEEQRRLLYVAMTRAKKRLYMLQSKPANGMSFIEEISALRGA